MMKKLLCALLAAALLLNHFNGIQSCCVKSNIIEMHYKLKKEGYYI